MAWLESCHGLTEVSGKAWPNNFVVANQFQAFYIAHITYQAFELHCSKYLKSLDQPSKGLILSASCGPFAHGLFEGCSLLFHVSFWKENIFRESTRLCDLWKTSTQGSPCPFEEILWKSRSNSAHQRPPDELYSALPSGAEHSVRLKKCKPSTYRVLLVHVSTVWILKD